MIIDAILSVIHGFIYALTAIFRILPDVSLPPNIAQSVATPVALAVSINDFFPVVETLAIFVGVFVVYEVAYFGYKIIMWIIRKIPGIS